MLDLRDNQVPSSSVGIQAEERAGSSALFQHFMRDLGAKLS